MNIIIPLHRVNVSDSSSKQPYLCIRRWGNRKDKVIYEAVDFYAKKSL